MMMNDPLQGLDSTFGGLEAMITGLCDEYPNFLRRHRELFVGVLLVFIYLCSLPTTTYVSLLSAATRLISRRWQRLLPTLHTITI